MALEPEADPKVAELLKAGRPRTAVPLARRELLTELLVGLAFLAVAVAIGVGFDAARDWDPVRAAVLVALFALAIRVHFDVGAAYTSPVQLVFVPMLLLLPTPWVPLLVAAGWLLGRLPDVLRGEAHRDRLLLPFGNSWFAIGPALVLCAAGTQTPDWGDWPWYLLALLAQFAFDVGANALREVSWGRRIAPAIQVRLLGWVQLIDALLSPVALLAAFASESFEYAFLLLVPPTRLLWIYAGERARRLENALAVADLARSRQELIASASHEMQTPLAVLLGLTDRIAPGRPEDAERRAQVHAAMTRELLQLRQLVRQFVDYTRLKSERDLRVEPRSTSLSDVAHEIGVAYAATGRVRLSLPDHLPPVRADPDRVHQMLMGLVGHALRSRPGDEPVTVGARATEVAVELTVDGAAARPGDPFDETADLGLYVVRELARAQGGDVTFGESAGGTRAFTAALPRASG